MSNKTASENTIVGKKAATKKKTIGPFHFLSELTERVTRDMRRAAMEKYLTGETHRQMLLAGAFAEQCDESSEKISKGEISPHLDICCCGGTFLSILTEQTFVTYKGCELPVEDIPEDEEDDRDGDDRRKQIINNHIFARLERLSSEDLLERLVDEYNCEETEFYQTHNDDTHNQEKFRQAVLKRFEAAAQYAKAIGSESARLWLEAICLLQPRPRISCAVYSGIGSNLIADCVAEAYKVAERAQRSLWVDNELAKLAPAKLAPKTSPKKGR